MKRMIGMIAFVLFYCLNVSSQATSIKVDSQYPGWLSSLINYGDQQTLENIKVTGYINGTDIKFIRELNLARSLSGVIDLEDANIVYGGEAYGKFENNTTPSTMDNTVTDYMFAYLQPIRKVILPKSTTNFGNYVFLETSVDTLVINGSMEILGVGGGYSNRFWRTRCIYFPEGVTEIGLGYLFHSYSGMTNIELFLPSKEA